GVERPRLRRRRQRRPLHRLLGPVAAGDGLPGRRQRHPQPPIGHGDDQLLPRRRPAGPAHRAHLLLARPHRGPARPGRHRRTVHDHRPRPRRAGRPGGPGMVVGQPAGPRPGLVVLAGGAVTAMTTAPPAAPASGAARTAARRPCRSILTPRCPASSLAPAPTPNPAWPTSPGSSPTPPASARWAAPSTQPPGTP